MLSDLQISNFAIIEDLHVSFSGGLNILSGETGAGKSVIVGALTLLLGGRASVEMIRSSKETAVVEAAFDVDPKGSITRQLETWGIEKAEQLLLKRVIARTGKSRAFVNGSLASVQMLNQLGSCLVNISGQHEHQTLLQTDTHVDVVDEFGGLLALRAEVGEGYRSLQELTQRCRDLEMREKEKVQRSELLRFQIKEIEQARLKKGEEELTREEKRVLTHAQKLIESINATYDVVYQGPGSAAERLRVSVAEIKGAVAIDSSIGPLFSALESALYQVEDVAHLLQEHLQKVSFDGEKLENIEMRLDEISKLKKRYGGSLEEVLRYHTKAREELARIESNERELEKLKQKRQKVEDDIMEKALVLSKKRARAASLLGEKVEEEFGGLGMKRARFKVELKKEGEEQKGSATKGVSLGEYRLTEKGFDLVEFLISPNSGEELKPLAKIASGGELSRIVLALKRIVTKEKKTSTLIFDEVDSGIGGATAEEVGIKLKDLSRRQQTICITHLPQIASFADQHQSISKKVEKGKTRAFVKKLDSPEEREAEVARMLGGADITAKTREHAREMIKGARGKA